MAHAIWNSLAKTSENKQLFLFLISVPFTLVLLPQMIAETVMTVSPLQNYLLLLLSAAIQAGYAHFLSRSLIYGDLSQVYPMMRGLATCMIPLFGILFLNESLTSWGWLGLGLIAAGFFLTSAVSLKIHGWNVQGKVLFNTIAVGLCTMFYVMVDKVNLQYFSPATLLAVSNIGFMLGLFPSIRFGQISLLRELREHGKWFLAGSILSPGSYLLFLFAMNLSPLSYVAPLREIGTVFSTLIGVFILKEGKGALRLLSTGMIFAGILFVGIMGM